MRQEIEWIDNCVYLLSGLLAVATAEPMVTATILTPEADRREGGQIHMRCVATNLEPDQVVDWETEMPKMTLRWNTSTITTNQRFKFATTQTDTGEIIQDFTITDLQRDDADEYICNVNNKTFVNGRDRLVATDRVTLRVYFSNESFPICSPDGLITVDTESEITLQCSATVYSAIIIEVFPIPPMSNNYTWTTSSMNGIVTESLNVTGHATDDNLTFECVIPSVTFPGTNHSCIIGPVWVLTSAVTERTSSSPPTPSANNQLSPQTPWIAGFVIAIILLAASATMNIFVILRLFKLKRLIESLTEKTVQEAKSDPYMELQPTDDRNREYMEPEARKTTTVQHTYYQTIEAEKEHTDDDYEVTVHNTKYETVSKH